MPALNRVLQPRLVAAFVMIATVLLPRPAGAVNPASSPALAQPAAITAAPQAQASSWTVSVITSTTSVSAYWYPVINDGGDVLFGTSGATPALWLARGGAVQQIARIGQAITSVLDSATGITVTMNALPAGDILQNRLLDSQGRVYFLAVNGDGKYWVMRWANGGLTRLPTDFTTTSSEETTPYPVLNLGASDGRWLERTVNQTTVISRYRISDGPNRTAFLLDLSRKADPVGSCFISAVERSHSEPILNTQGVLLYRSGVFIRQPLTPPDCITTSIRRDTKIGAAGALSATLASGSTTAAGSPTVSTGEQVVDPAMNNAGVLGYLRYSYDTSPPTQELKIRQADGSTSVLQSFPDSTLSVQTIFNTTSANTLHLSMYDNSVLGIYAVNSASIDRIVQEGSTVAGFSNISLESSLDMDGNDANEVVFVFSATPNAGQETYVLAKATRGVARWNNATGGDWATAGNWSPAAVPGSTAETLFDLPNSYDVTVGTRTSGRSRIEKGAVGWRGANLTLNGPLAVSRDATLTVPEGKVVASDVTVGALPPTNPAAPPIAKLNVFNAGTIFSDTGRTTVGNAGDGELFISGADMSSAEVRVGSGSPGTVTLGLPTTFWTTGSMLIGDGHAATFNIERGAAIVTRGDVLIGGGATLQDKLVEVTIDNESTTPQRTENWYVIGDTTIGDNMRVLLTLRNGAIMGTQDFNDAGRLQIGTKARSAPNELAIDDVFITVSGMVGNAPSQLYGDETYIGMVSGSKVDITLSDGGILNTSGTLSVGHVAGSRARITASGRGANGSPSAISVGVAFDDDCAFGRDGVAEVSISDGARINCIGTLFAGNSATGVANISVDGPDSAINVFWLCLGGGEMLCYDAPGVRGNARLTLSNGAVVTVTRGIEIGSGAVVAGNGRLVAEPSLLGIEVYDGGAVNPGVQLPTFPAQRLGAQATLAEQPGTLTISGSLSLSNTAVITIDLTGPTSYDKLVVLGGTTLNGKLVLNFSNAYAPQQGDVFEFLQGATGGQFDGVEIKGLAPGFTYTVNTSNGKTVMTATNNGVATTQRDTRKVLLPLVRR